MPDQPASAADERPDAPARAAGGAEGVSQSPSPAPTEGAAPLAQAAAAATSREATQPRPENDPPPGPDPTDRAKQSPRNRRNRSFRHPRARELVAVIPAAVLAQAWRGPRQARLAQVGNACLLEPLDEPLAKRAGELSATTRLCDVIDASLVASASRRGDAILTSDPRDLRRLAALVGNVEIVKL